MKEKLYEAFAGLGNSIVTAAPKVAMGLLLVVLGLIVAKLVEVAFRTVLVRVRFDTVIEKLGIDKALHRMASGRNSAWLFRDSSIFSFCSCWPRL